MAPFGGIAQQKVNRRFGHLRHQTIEGWMVKQLLQGIGEVHCQAGAQKLRVLGGDLHHLTGLVVGCEGYIRVEGDGDGFGQIAFALLRQGDELRVRRGSEDRDLLLLPARGDRGGDSGDAAPAFAAPCRWRASGGRTRLSSERRPT